ncbi:MAG TPA: hypothetical protein ENI62_09105 [Gammaproteobacteria bacterium]|nr:hypothetical protein [Gammaproteobacteria bacterium]
MDTLQRLHHDHQNISRLLQVLWQQISRPDHDQRPDYEVLRDIMLYMCQYTDLFHHPQEELIFQQLLQYSPELAPTIEILTDQHQALVQQSKKLQETLQAAIHQFVLWDDLQSALTEYATLLQHHMDLEDQQILPAVKHRLNAQDWQEIEERSRIRIDPLFGKDVQDHFRDLYRVLTRDFSESD